jgi:hypothetical protein
MDRWQYGDYKHVLYFYLFSNFCKTQHSFTKLVSYEIAKLLNCYFLWTSWCIAISSNEPKFVYVEKIKDYITIRFIIIFLSSFTVITIMIPSWILIDAWSPRSYSWIIEIMMKCHIIRYWYLNYWSYKFALLSLGMYQSKCFNTIVHYYNVI